MKNNQLKKILLLPVMFGAAMAAEQPGELDAIISDYKKLLPKISAAEPESNLSKADAIISMLQEQMPPSLKAFTAGRNELVQKVSGIMAAEKILRLVFLGFPGKSSNEKYTLGPDPDLGSLLGMTTLSHFMEQIKSIYSNVSVEVLTDGPFYREVLKQPEGYVDAYLDKLKAIVASADLKIKLLKLQDISGLATTTLCDSCTKDYILSSYPNKEADKQTQNGFNTFYKHEVDCEFYNGKVKESLEFDVQEFLQNSKCKYTIKSVAPSKNSRKRKKFHQPNMEDVEKLGYSVSKAFKTVFQQKSKIDFDLKIEDALEKAYNYKVSDATKPTTKNILKTLKYWQKQVNVGYSKTVKQERQQLAESMAKYCIDNGWKFSEYAKLAYNNYDSSIRLSVHASKVSQTSLSNKIPIMLVKPSDVGDKISESKWTPWMNAPLVIKTSTGYQVKLIQKAKVKKKWPKAQLKQSVFHGSKINYMLAEK